MLIREWHTTSQSQVSGADNGSRSAAEKMTNPRRFKDFRKQMLAASSSAAAQTATQAASLQLDLRSLGDRRARVSREQRILVRL